MRMKQSMIIHQMSMATIHMGHWHSTCVSRFGLLGSGTRVCSVDGSSTAGSFDGSAPSCVGEYSVDVNSLKGVPYVSQLLINCPH